MKRNTKLMIIVGILLIIVVGASFAYYVATTEISGTGTNVGGTAETLIKVEYDACTGILATDNIYPGITVSKDFTVTVTPGSRENEAIYVIKLNIAENTFKHCTNENYDEITNACKKNRPELIYTLKDGSGKVIATGDLTEKTGEIELSHETKTVNKKTVFNYTLEITNVETNADQNHNKNANIEAEVKVEFSGPINYLATITNSYPSSTSSFLGSEIKREQIKSITTLDHIEIPEGSTSFDVSEKKNGSIMAWYGVPDENGLYDVYIGEEGGVKANPNSRYLFSHLTNLTTIDLSNFDTSNVTNMFSMFYKTSGLTSLDINHFDTSKVTSMTQMFSGMSSLTSLDVSNFDTSKVTDMQSMFLGMSSLTNLDLSSFDTSNVTTMYAMFSRMSSLTSLDVSNFDTSKVTYMQSMFLGMSSLTNLYVSNFNTSNVTNMSYMFSGMKLTSLDVSSFDTSNVTDMHAMFLGMSSLVNLDLSNFDTSNVTNMSAMFQETPKLNILKLNKATFNSVTNYTDMFYRSTVSSIEVKDTDAKTFIEARLSDASKTATVTIAS